MAQGSKGRQGDRSVLVGPKCSIRDPEAEPKIFLESTDGYGMSWYSSTFHIFAVPGPGFFKIFDFGPWIGEIKISFPRLDIFEISFSV